MPQERRGAVQHDDVEEGARDDAPEPAGETPHHRPAIGAGGVLVEQDADVEIAVGPMPPGGSAAEQEGEAHFGQFADRACEAIRR